MCDLKRHLKRPKKGYKVVVLKNDKKYSPAMGILYEDGKQVTIPKKQDRLTLLYRADILNPKADHGFNKHMIGRTAVFKCLSDAKSMSYDISWNDNTATAIFEAIVSTDVMSGMAGKGSTRKVYAGRVISFGNQVY